MPNPTIPVTKVSAAEAPTGIESMELRSPFHFLNPEHLATVKEYLGGDGVLYTEQELTPEEAGQVLENISGGTGAIGNLILGTETGNDSLGILFSYNGGAPFGGLFAQGVNSKVVLNAPYVTISAEGGAVQLGHTSALDDIVTIQKNGAADIDTTTTASKHFLFVSSFYDGATKYAAIALRNIVDVAGNQTLFLTNDTGHLLPDGITAALRLPDGTTALPSLQVGSATRGLLVNDGVMRIQNDASAQYLELSNYIFAGSPSMIFRTGYSNSVNCALGLYYGGVGFLVESNQEFSLCTQNGVDNNAVKVMSILYAGPRIEDGKHLALGTSTGTKIGTATGQKLGFWNATPVVQQVLATGAGATADNIISMLQTLGLCKQS